MDVNKYFTNKNKYLLFINKYLLCLHYKILNSSIMTKINNIVFWFLYAIIWIIFIGLSIEAGGLVVNFFFGWFKPEIVSKLYQKLNITDTYKDSRWVFFVSYSIILILSIAKAILFYIVISLMHTMDRKKPFNTFVARKILRIGYLTLFIGLFSYIASKIVNYFMHYGFEPNKLSQFWVDSEAFIFVGAIIYIIATIFKQGVDIQNENDLTV
jgi:hypothetical protein